MNYNKQTNSLNNKSKIIIIIVSLILITTILFIIIPNNKSTTYYLELLGDTDIIINQNSLYQEPGFKAYDNRSNDLTSEVTISGKVNTTVAGEYTITYRLNNITKTRTITVIDNIKQTTFLILNGNNTIYLNVGDTYQEPGYTVIDSIDNNLTENVTITGTVNTKKAGSYKLIYSVTNKNNITITQERTIIVMNTMINLNYTPTSITNQSVTINIDITDNYFDYLIFPDNKRSTNRTEKYEVTQNGTYKFIIYNKNGTSKEQSIVITNIDKEKPTGSCSGYYQQGKSYITITAHDNIKVNKYTLNNQIYTNNKLTINQELSLANITIHDQANNTSTITCKLQNKNTIYPSYFGVKTYTDNTGNTMSYWLYIPENATDNMPMIVFLHGSEESGTDYSAGTTKAITWGPGHDIKKMNAKFNAIILMPQSIGQWPPSILKTVINLSNKIATDYKVDKNRISISGFSVGCVAISEMLSLYPNYFSAAVPIECHRDVSDSYAKYYINTPTWTFASQDYTNDIAKNMAKNINNAGGNAKFKTFPYLGHTGLVGYNNYSIFTDQDIKLINWMTSQKRK